MTSQFLPHSHFVRRPVSQPHVLFVYVVLFGIHPDLQLSKEKHFNEECSSTKSLTIQKHSKLVHKGGQLVACNLKNTNLPYLSWSAIGLKSIHCKLKVGRHPSCPSVAK